MDIRPRLPVNLRPAAVLGLAAAAAAAVLGLMHLHSGPAEATSSWGCSGTVPANATGSCSASEGDGYHTNNWSKTDEFGIKHTQTAGCDIPHGSSGGCGHSNPGWTFTGHSSTHGSHSYSLSWSCNSGYTQKGNSCEKDKEPEDPDDTDDTTPDDTTTTTPTLCTPGPDQHRHYSNGAYLCHDDHPAEVLPGFFYDDGIRYLTVCRDGDEVRARWEPLSAKPDNPSKQVRFAITGYELTWERDDGTGKRQAAFTSSGRKWTVPSVSRDDTWKFTIRAVLGGTPPRATSTRTLAGGAGDCASSPVPSPYMAIEACYETPAGSQPFVLRDGAVMRVGWRHSSFSEPPNEWAVEVVAHTSQHWLSHTVSGSVLGKVTEQSDGSWATDPESTTLSGSAYGIELASVVAGPPRLGYRQWSLRASGRDYRDRHRVSVLVRPSTSTGYAMPRNQNLTSSRFPGSMTDKGNARGIQRGYYSDREASDYFGVCSVPRKPAKPKVSVPGHSLVCHNGKVSASVPGEWASEAPSGWEREASYDAQWREAGSVSAWADVDVYVSDGELAYEISASPGMSYEIRLRAHGRQRQWSHGQASPWSDTKSLSWQLRKSAPCPGPAQPSAPAVPTPTPGSIVCTATQFATPVSFSGWAASAPTGWQRSAEHEAERRYGSNGSWQPATATDTPVGKISVSGPAKAGSTVEVRVRVRGRHRQQSVGFWSIWSSWSPWSAWSATVSAVCPSTAKSAPPASPDAASVSCSGSTATVTLSGLATATPLRETRYIAAWLKGLYSGSPALTESAVPPGGGLPAAATATLTLTVGTDLDSTADLTSLWVYSEQRTRTRATDAWDLWSDRSAPAKTPKHTGGCWAGTGS